MKVFALPGAIEALLFDIDNTLYRNREYQQSQVDLLVAKYASVSGIGIDLAYRAVESAQAVREGTRAGGKTSLGNAMATLGIDLTTNAEWRSELFSPEEYLHFDPELLDCLSKLADRFTLGAVTNNTESIGKRTLRVLGVENLFEAIVGLDTTYHSKPSPEPFVRALSDLEVVPKSSVSVGDRYGVDIEPALGLGMGGILVASITEVYGLPSYLESELGKS